MIEESELKRRIVEAHNIRRWYQKMPYGGIEFPIKTHFEDGKTNIKSYGDGRWYEYIRPMLVKHDDDWENSTFCEIGCSAGLFLLRGWIDFGFKRLIGVEAANGGFVQLQITKDYYDQMPLEIHKVALGKLTKTIADSKAPQIDMKTFPIVDITLMSCIHYHMEINYLKNYLKNLASKSLYFMLVTDEKAGGPINATSSFFKDNIIGDEWLLVGSAYTLPELKSLKPPCKDLTVLFYKSRQLKRLLVEECYEKQMGWHKDKGGKHKGWYEYSTKFYNDVFPKFMDNVLSGRITKANHRACEVYDWQRGNYFGSTAFGEKVASERTLSYINMVLTIKEHGQEQPIDLQEHLGMVDPWDGWHRVAVLKHLGYKYVYGKDVIPCLDQT